MKPLTIRYQKYFGYLNHVSYGFAQTEMDSKIIHRCYGAVGREASRDNH